MFTLASNFSPFFFGFYSFCGFENPGQDFSFSLFVSRPWLVSSVRHRDAEFSFPFLCQQICGENEKSQVFFVVFFVTFLPYVSVGSIRLGWAVWIRAKRAESHFVAFTIALTVHTQHTIWTWCTLPCVPPSVSAHFHAFGTIFISLQEILIHTSRVMQK